MHLVVEALNARVSLLQVEQASLLCQLMTVCLLCLDDYDFYLCLLYLLSFPLT